MDTKGGTRKLSDGVYTFETAAAQRHHRPYRMGIAADRQATGVTDVSMGQADNVSKKATVVLAEQRNVSKRLMLRSSPYTEAAGQIARLFIQGAKDHLPAKKALKCLGTDGEDWDAVIKRTDLDLWGDIDVKITSSSIQMRNSQLKKEARMKTLTEIAPNPTEAAQINPKWLVKEKLKSGAELDDAGDRSCHGYQELRQRTRSRPRARGDRDGAGQPDPRNPTTVPPRRSCRSSTTSRSTTATRSAIANTRSSSTTRCSTARSHRRTSCASPPRRLPLLWIRPNLHPLQLMHFSAPRPYEHPLPRLRVRHRERPIHDPR